MTLAAGDLLTAGLAFARERAPRAALYQLDARRLPFEREFDVVGAFDVSSTSRWVVFAEPSHFVNFRPPGRQRATGPRLYAQLLGAAYGAMHAVRSDVVVIGGNVHPAVLNGEETPDTFLQNMILPNGRRPRLDMFGSTPTRSDASIWRSPTAPAASTSMISTGSYASRPLLARPAPAALYRRARLEHRA